MVGIVILSHLGKLKDTNLFFFLSFLTLKVLMSALGRTPESRRSIYVQYGCTQELGGPEVRTTYIITCIDFSYGSAVSLPGP